MSQVIKAFFIVSDPLLALRVKFIISSMGLLIFIAKRVHILTKDMLKILKCFQNLILYILGVELSIVCIFVFQYF